jgi:hypothetical protein
MAEYALFIYDDEEARSAVDQHTYEATPRPL